MNHYSRRQFLEFGVGAGALWTLYACTNSDGGGERGSGSEAPELPNIESARRITNPDDFPTTFNERPQFKEMVARGELPPVAERIGQDPIVLQPLQSIGTYGGRIRRVYLGNADRHNANRFAAGPDNLLYWDDARENVIPNIARDFEQSSDTRELVLHLRRGMHWSDGQPFTAEDIIFWRNSVNLNPEISRGSPELRVNGKQVTVEKVDDLTVRFVSPEAHPLLPALLAGYTNIGGQTFAGGLAGGGFAPRHYLSQFLPEFVGEAEANRIAADAGFDGWVAFFQSRTGWQANSELPVLTPWIVTRPINNTPWEFGPNPYSIWVDSEGNQLPYIDEISMSLAEDRDVRILQATSGELDFQDRAVDVQSLPLLLENEERGDYKVHRLPSTDMEYAIRINLAYDKDAVLGELLRNVDFRRALSLGVDRDQVNEAFFVGTSVPTSTLVADFSPYFPGEHWRTKWATHDPEKANAMLDEIGLTDKDGDGFRLRPDGAGIVRLDYDTGPALLDYTAMGEMIRDQWRQIGVQLDVTVRQGNSSEQMALANEIMLAGNTAGSDDPFLRPDTLIPAISNVYAGLMGIPYAKWFETDGAEGVEPPESVKELKDAMELYHQGLREVDEEERIRIAKEIYKLHADQVWSIGVVGFGYGIYGLYIAKNNMRNIPARVLNTLHTKTPSNAYPMTFYYEGA
jgi:peptide/nickel transport system substrate-binding protein